MAFFPKVLSQQPGGRLITLDDIHHGKDSILLLLEYTLDTNLPSLQAVVLPYVDLQNALSTIMVFLTALPLIKELISEQKKYSSWNSLVLRFLPS